MGSVRGRRTPLVQVLVAVLAAAITAACDLGPSADVEPSPAPTLVAVDPVGGEPPQLAAAVEVELGTAVAVFGLGCRPQSPHQRCSADGDKTYTRTGGLRAARVTGVWMQLDTGRGRWAVNVRLAPGDRRTAALVAERALEVGGLVVVLDAHSGDVLQAVPATDVHGALINRPDLHRLAAESAVDAFVEAAVTAATGR